MSVDAGLSEANRARRADGLRRLIDKQQTWRLQVIAQTEQRIRKAQTELAELGFEESNIVWPRDIRKIPEETLIEWDQQTTKTV